MDNTTASTRAMNVGQYRIEGFGYTYRRASTWWIRYSRRGREYRESSRSKKETDAWKLLRKRHGEIHGGQFVGPREERVTFEDLKTAYLQDYEIRGLRSKETAEARGKHLAGFFGIDRALNITTYRIRAYQAHRLQEKAQAATINREVAALARMFHLTVKAGRLSACPVFPTRLEENPPRQGFFEHHEYLAIRKHLRPDYQDVLDFAYYTGWRKKEVLGLQWREVDMGSGTVRLSPERSKTKTGRVLPLSPPLREVLAR